MASPADLSPCPVCGDRTNHAHRPAAQISCDAASYTRAAAVTWLAKTAGMDPELEVLLAAGWTAPERGAE